ncbi:MAG: bifunctional diaminohydroxyphosphoribosylaminopyrimidine deaminase/5-amino-6-(5-phosphoribosylamino)uracil reductase RibD [Selenomonadaceae bacterium]|nr:bifunctional diaminohydroxyphosphoribosylaminopyrimidine deaminase/5-amino-6-(5-phosphoribosylamino)uracil reductase RibD [Selenomonadaceae bacterium]
MNRSQDETFMQMALELAENGRGRTSPNPLVGAVIVKEGKVVAAGWHRRAGTPHAEIHALNMAGDLAKGADMYVTLEPCAHYGRTGPCAKAIAAAGIKRVVMATLDPNPKVAGGGARILREAGTEVAVGVLEAAARRQNEVFFKWITTGQPFVLLKTAMSLDGKIATFRGESQWITNETSRDYVHELRDAYDGIMVGIGTVLGDNPSLTTRLKNRRGKNPTRIVVDSKARTPLTARLLTDGLAPTVIAVSQKASPEKTAALKAAGATLITAGEGERVDLQILMKELGKRGICSLLVEGGGTLNFSLLKDGLVDKVAAFIAPKLIGGREALTPLEGEGFAALSEAVTLKETSFRELDGDLLLTGYVK